MHALTGTRVIYVRQMPRCRLHIGSLCAFDQRGKSSILVVNSEARMHERNESIEQTIETAGVEAGRLVN